MYTPNVPLTLTGSRGSNLATRATSRWLCVLYGMGPSKGKTPTPPGATAQIHAGELGAAPAYRPTSLSRRFPGLKFFIAKIFFGNFPQLASI